MVCGVLGLTADGRDLANDELIEGGGAGRANPCVTRFSGEGGVEGIGVRG